jgi:hypothetical protein
MTLFDTIQELIISYTAGKLTLAAFREKFVPLYVAINRKSDIEAVTLADRVEGFYADLLADEITEEQFSRKLSSFYPMVVVLSDPEAALSNVTGSTFESITGNRRSMSNDSYTFSPQYAECT